MSDPDGPLATLTRSLDQSALEIDRIFARAGDRLGQGMTIFEGLTDRLRAMSQELTGDDIDLTRQALVSVADQLRSFSRGLPAETGLLRDIAVQGGAASGSIERLLGHTRLIMVLARSSRIEAAQVPSSQQDFGRFFDEIAELVQRAKRTIETCACDHDRITGLLASALAQQSGFAESYGETLATLAGRLEITLTEIEERRRRSIVATTQAAAQYQAVTLAVGGVIVALQSGDSLRQRLEHARVAMDLAGEMATDAPAAGGRWTCDERAALRAVLCRLVAVHLSDAGDTIATEVATIDRALQSLSDDTATTLASSRSLYGGDARQGGSALSALEREIAEASDLIGKCNAARSLVDGLVQTLTTFLDRFRETSETLSETIVNIVLIGINAGLRAMRLGQAGRGLVVIAQELKAAADQIVEASNQLSPTFVAMQNATAALTRRGAGGSDYLTSLDGTMRASLAQLQRAGTRLGATLDGVAGEGTAFTALLDDARLAFSTCAATGEAIASAAALIADDVGDCPADLGPDTIERLSDFLDEALYRTYTMVSERDLHRAVLAEFGWPTAAEAPTADPFDDWDLTDTAEALVA